MAIADFLIYKMIKMKKYIYILAIALGVYSCDMDTNPTDAVPENIVFENAQNANLVLDGTWAYMMDTYFTYQNPGWSTVLLASDAMANDVAMQPNKYGYYGHYSFTSLFSISAYTTESVWTIAYKVIDNTNHLITKIDNVPGDENLKKSIKAQAYALRGYIYLNLATFYSHSYAYDAKTLSVPIYLEPTTLKSTGNPRSTVGEVYKQAEEDLLAAYDLSKDFKRKAKHQMNQQVIAGVLARLYLQKGDNWEAAEKYATIAQKDAKWMTKNEYLTGFNDRANNEWIWGHGQATYQDAASYSFNYKDVSSESSYYYSYFADPYFKELFKDGDKYDLNDVRTELFEWDLKRYKGGLMYKKFRFKTDQTADIVLMRKPEMLLIEAEALAEQSKLNAAIDKLNELREIRGAATPDLSAKSKEQLVDEIAKERRKELFGEGFGLSDIKRKQGAVERKAYPGKVLVPDYVPATPKDSIFVVGHTIRTQPDGKPFEVNSKYYNFSIPEKERTNNPYL